MSAVFLVPHDKYVVFPFLSSQKYTRPLTFTKIIITYYSTSSFAKKKKPVDFDGELKTGDVRYDNLT